MLTHIMLDLETLGVTPYSAIIMIGACKFDPYTETPDHVITDRFEVAIKPDNVGLRVDIETLMWWMDPERDIARKYWRDKPLVSLHTALDGFSDWLRSLGRDVDLRMWGNGAGFDNTLLRQAYDMAAREAPWNPRHDRCFRTLRSMLTFEEGVYLGTRHTALVDAENQAIRANQIVRQLGIKLT